MGVFPDVSGRGATVCDAKRDAEAPFGSNPGPAASADEQMRPRTRAASLSAPRQTRDTGVCSGDLKVAQIGNVRHRMAAPALGDVNLLFCCFFVP